MLSKSVGGAFLALLSLVSAQTFTVCDPTKKVCPPNPAFADSIDIDYTKGETSFFRELAGTTLTYDKDKGAVFSIANEMQAPTIESPEFIFFGKLEVELRVAPGAGIVTSIVLQSLTLDEIDWEWLGGDPNSVQTNYFSKGDTSTYDRGGHHSMGDSVNQFHTYTIDWTREALTWSIDGAVVRVLKYEDAKGGKEYPQTPMQVKLGSWVAGRSDAPQGTVDWAGGLANFDDGPSRAYYRRVSVTDYAGGSKGATQYVYGDKTGTWQSIKIKTDGEGLQDKEVDDKDKDDDKKDDEESTSAVNSSSVSAPSSSSASSTAASETTSTGSANASSTDDAENADPTDDADDEETEEDEDAGSGAASLGALGLAGVAMSGVAVFANLF